MKILLPLLIVTSFALSTYAQNHKIIFGKIDTIYSKILNEKREIWVYVPNHNNMGKYETINNEYPVLYFLDGDWHFSSILGTIEQLSYVNGNAICPEMILVGIISKDRFKDLTPTIDSNISVTSGYYEKFISFIENELIPYIEVNYKVAPYRMFLGHSLGGLTVLNTMIKHTTLFNSYVAIDPSVWWDKQKILKESQTVLKEKEFGEVKLFLALANSLGDNIDTTSIMKDTTSNSLHMRSVLELNDILKTNKFNGLNYRFKYYRDETHGSVPHLATYDALHHIFDFYNLDISKNDFADTTMILPNRIINHYKKISQKMGYTVKPSENTINMLGYTSLMKKNFKQAELYFRLNTENFPESFNVYDSYGDYFSEIGNTLKAIEMYRKALTIFENDNTRMKLNKLSNN